MLISYGFTITRKRIIVFITHCYLFSCGFPFWCDSITFLQKKLILVAFLILRF